MNRDQEAEIASGFVIEGGPVLHLRFVDGVLQYYHKVTTYSPSLGSSPGFGSVEYVWHDVPKFEANDVL